MAEFNFAPKDIETERDIVVHLHPDGDYRSCLGQVSLCFVPQVNDKFQVRKSGEEWEVFAVRSATSLGMSREWEPNSDTPMVAKSNHWHLSVRRLG